MLPLLIAIAASAPSAPAATPDVKVPPGFAISAYADNALAPDIYTLTIDAEGRVLVAGRGYVRVLVDDDGDGVADRAIDLIDGLKDGPMGLLAEGDSLYVVSEGGLQRYRGYNGKDKLKTPPETLVKLKTSGEHDAHMVRRGPDGWLYLLCGNAAGASAKTVTGRRTPIKEPVAGALLRISPDGTEVEVVADGFRNPYSFDFNLAGEPFASDSDNERCIGLPWYESCRFYHLVPGGNYGWRSPQVGKFWRKPPYFLDCVPPVCYLGRGSPTGVACYRHMHFPEYYRGGFFLADWTFGRIDFVPLAEDGSTYTGKPEVFAEAVGTSGFAPTGLAVHPKTGELFVSIGGRGTRGAVYRIKHQTNAPGLPLPMAKHTLDWSAEAGKQWLALAGAEVLGTGDEQRARREALELMLRYRERMPWGEPLFKVVKPDLTFPDPLVRLAAARTMRGLVIPTAQIVDPQQKVLLAYADVKDDPAWAIEVAIEVLKEPHSKHKLQAVRVIQLAFGDLTAPGTEGTVWEGYTLRNPRNRVPSQELIKLLSTMAVNDPLLEREVFRTLAALGQMCHLSVNMSAYILDQITAESSIESDIHYLAMLAQSQEWDWGVFNTKRTVNLLIGFDQKIQSQHVQRDTNWPLRLEEILIALGKTNPELATRLIKHRDFGRPEHLMLLKLGINQTAAAWRFLRVSEKDPTYAWTPELVRLLAVLPPGDTRPTLERLWEQPHFRDAIVQVLAREPSMVDRAHFVEGLSSFDPGIVRTSSHALAKLALTPQPAEVAAAIKALRRTTADDKTSREAVVALLHAWSGETFTPDGKVWTAWAEQKYPDVRKLLTASDGFDAAAWKKREATIPWSEGDATRGKLVFTRASCAACHDGARALGPSLQGVGQRFSRADLLTAVLQPSKDVSPRYRPTRLATTDDQVHIGMIVYEATDGVMLQTGPDAVVRIAGDRIASRRLLDISLMPSGLLDKLADRDVADLFAYLQTNGVAGTKP